MKRATRPCCTDGPARSTSPTARPSESDGRARFTSFPFTKNKQQNPLQNHNEEDFSQLPYDVLLRISATFNLPNIRSASLVCKSWCQAIKPLRESMVCLKWGKRYKHGRSGVKRNLSKALDYFLQGAALGSTLAMVDAGLVYWEMGRREKGMNLYRKAAELCDPVGQCNLGISLLQANPPDPEEAVKWLYKASVTGHVRAQYQLALSLHKRQGPNSNLQEAAKWYMKAAEGGYVRAMYNTALCYSVGEGLMQSHKLAKKWMKRAADRGHSKAQLEHGMCLFSEGETMQAVVYLELASRAGEVTANPVKNVILQELSASRQDHAMFLANSWLALPSSSSH
ncbi:F-box protein [Capsicum baccatum]|uniref:F-box protein n=1 Tax=Capsicum baccatum TaxID=33114 RepID=A0A2G2XSM3_CAPBA|nr:F-box protein [Capsicum baccatum]